MSKIMAHMDVEKKLDRMISKLLNSNKVDIVYNDWGNVTYASLFQNKMAIIALIRAGIPYHLFSLIQDYTPFSETDWAGFLDISTKSLQRYKQADKNFRPIQSEKIIEMEEKNSIGLEVFEDMD